METYTKEQQAIVDAIPVPNEEVPDFPEHLRSKSERFGLVLSPNEKKALHRLAHRERIPAAAVVRRLVWREAERHGLLPADRQQAQGAQAQEATA